MSQSAAQPGWNPTDGRRAGAGWHGSARVSDQDRDVVADWLGTAFADGRLGQEEFELRLDRALTAVTRAELSATLEGLYRTTPVAGLPAPLSGSDRGWALAAHLLGLLTSFVGPLLVFLGAGRRSAYVREQAAEALNWQISFILLNLALVAATVFTLGLAALLWIPIVLLWPWMILVAGFAAAIGSPLRPKRVIRLVR